MSLWIEPLTRSGLRLRPGARSKGEAQVLRERRLSCLVHWTVGALLLRTGTSRRF
jgi:hypothetical protein